jgi:hypothetical protein
MMTHSESKPLVRSSRVVNLSGQTCNSDISQEPLFLLVVLTEEDYDYDKIRVMKARDKYSSLTVAISNRKSKVTT